MEKARAAIPPTSNSPCTGSAGRWARSPKPPRRTTPALPSFPWLGDYLGGSAPRFFGFVGCISSGSASPGGGVRCLCLYVQEEVVVIYHLPNKNKPNIAPPSDKTRQTPQKQNERRFHFQQLKLNASPLPNKNKLNAAPPPNKSKLNADSLRTIEFERRSPAQ